MTPLQVPLQRAHGNITFLANLTFVRPLRRMQRLNMQLQGPSAHKSFLASGARVRLRLVYAHVFVQLPPRWKTLLAVIATVRFFPRVHSLVKP